MSLFLLATVALLLTQDSSISANTASSELDSVQADYVARAGMQHALWQTTNNACSGNVNIPATYLGKHSYTATMTSAANTNAFIVGADRDTHLDPANPKTNYGSELTATVKNNPPDSVVALYHFDVSSVAKAARVASATAWFYVNDNDPLGATEVRSMDLDWTETGATWANAGAGISKTVYGLLPPQDSTGAWVNVNLTALVQSWANEPATNHGIVLSGTSDKETAKYTTREYSKSNQRPFLQVTIADDEVSPVVIKAIGTLVNGVERTLTQPDAVAYQPPVLYTVRPGPAESADAEIWDDEPDNNYGDEEESWVSSAAGDTTRSLLRFKVDAIPVGARIVEATLFMHRQSGSAADEPVSAHRITNSWSEGSVTWNRRESGTSWNTAGGDFHSVAVATAAVGAGNQNPEWNLTPLVQGWVDGSYPNYGVALVAGMDGMEGERFYTSDQPQLDRRPSLSVSYACDCGSACLSQGGGGKVLMVVRDATNMWYYDIQKKAILESWGYTVNIIDDGASAAEFDAGIAANDVAYISEPSSEASLNTKLSNAPIGVVSDEGRMNDELGMAQSYATPVLGTAIKVTDTSHYITKVFPVGPLDIYTAAMEGLTVAGTEAPELQTLADWGGAGSLVALESGAKTVSGGSSTGRRVMLPFGRQIDSNVDWDRLSSNGRLIAQRAIAWAIGNEEKSPAKLLLVVGNAGSPSSGDLDRQALIESWGYSVTLIDDGDSQANFDDAAAANDIIYVTGSTAGTATIGDKLTGSAKPIVNERRSMMIEFGFSDSASDSLVSDSYSATDATHYITVPFAGSGITHFTSAITMPLPSGILAPGLHSVASSGTVTNALPTLDAGAERWDGTPAAGRRVQVPFESADISQLTEDGLTLMRRAIDWGAGVSLAGKKILLVVGNAGSPSSGDLDRQALIASWGHAVTLIDDGDSQANFDTAVAENDVVYVAGSGSSTTIGTKLTAATVGVLSEDMGLVDELGIAEASFVKKNSQSINVIDNTHYVSSGFSLGELQLYSYVPQIWTVAGALAPGLQLLGETQEGGSSFPPGLAILEAGAELYGGGFAAGRRVQVPWAQGSFDITALNSYGRTIMQRAIEWGAGAGQVTTPLLFVVSDYASPTADEGAKKSLIESWNYTVTMIADEADQAKFDTALAANDVAYVSADVSDTTLGTKLRAATIGVVNEKGEQVDELGFSWDLLFKSRHEIDVIDNAHYITEQFSTGLLAVSTVDQPVHMMNGGVAPGASKLGESFNIGSNWLPSLAAIETGGTLRDGGTAAGRRVQLPWGGGTFDINLLANDGRTIMKRAIEWGAGAGAAASPSYKVLLIVGNDTPLASKDVGYKALMESWGHTVAVLNDGASQANYDTAMAAADVIYASGSAVGSSMLDKATYTTKGMVNEVNGKIDNFGFSSSTSATANFDAFSTTNAAHYITEPFAGSAVTVFTSSLTNPVPGGTLAPDLQNVGEVSGTLALGTLDTGATRYDGNPSEGRRAHLPFTSAETTDMTADGKTILQRALEWAAGAGGGGGGGGGGGSAPVFESFEEHRDSNNGTSSISVTKPAGTATGDLLVAVVVTNRNNESTLAADDPGWTLLTRDRQANSSTTGVWWKVAGGSEPANYGFSWNSSNPGRSYSWIMRFSGNDPTNPIDVWDKFGDGGSTTPPSPAVTTTVDDTLILRIGGFDDDDITVGDPGMAGHTPITMQESNSGTGTVSGGAAYVEQATSGDSGTANFTLTASEQSRTITIGIAPAP